jgi:general secretion pathway protein I
MMKARRGFTLLEVVVALAILAVALMAIFSLNSGAVASHAYVKRLSVATLLARSKMTDLEQLIYDKGMPADDDEESGDFSDEGFGNFKWTARIIAPKAEQLSPDQILGSLFNIPMGDPDSAADPSGGGIASQISQLLGASMASKAASGGNPLALALAQQAGGAMQGMVGNMVNQLAKTIREIHLTVSWGEGDQAETLDVVTYIVSTGKGSDRNGTP